MRKYFVLMCVALLALGMNSCQEKDLGPKNTIILDLDIKSNQWGYSNLNDNNFFYADFNIPELTWNIYNNGHIAVYKESGTNTENATQQVLPYVRHNEYSYPIDDDADGKQDLDDQNNPLWGWGFYTETVDYEYTAGRITIYYTASDFDYELDESFVPGDMHFRVIMYY